MYPRFSVVILGLVVFITLGAVVVLGFRGRTALLEAVPDNRHLFRQSLASAAAERSLSGARAGLYAFMAGRDPAAMERAVRSVGAAVVSLKEAGGVGSPEAMEEKTRKTVTALTELQRLVTLLWDLHDNIVQPNIKALREHLSREVRAGGRNPAVAVFLADTQGTVVAVGSAFKVFAHTRSVKDADVVSRGLNQLRKTLNRRDDEERREFLREMASGVSALERAFADMQEAASTAQWRLTEAEMALHAQQEALGTLSLKMEEATIQSGELLSHRLEKELWVVMSVAVGGISLALILVVNAFIACSRR